MAPSTMITRYDVPCVPPLWARGGHQQTIAGHILPVSCARIGKDSGYARREVELADGERLVAFTREGSSDVLVLLMHGLSGDANAEYMRLTADALIRAGHGVWAVNHRGCGEGRGLAGKPYHSGKTDDLEAVLSACRQNAPHKRIVVAGFSMSGNLALLHSAEGRRPAPDGIVAINPAVDLERTSVAIGKGVSRVYERRFLWRLRKAVKEREAEGRTLRSYDIPLGLSLLEFDDLFTAPECGFESGLDYYRRCSSLPRLGEVATPSVILTAADDPFVDATTLAAAPRSPAVSLHVERHGGHVGYVTRRGLGCGRWLPGAIVHYVDQLVEN